MDWFDRLEQIVWNIIGVWLIGVAFIITAAIYGAPFWLVIYLLWGMK